MSGLDENLMEWNSVRLTRNEFLVLRFLTGNPGKIFSREEINEGAGLGDRDQYAFNQMISRLRKKIKSASLVTRVGFGYGWIVPD